MKMFVPPAEIEFDYVNWKGVKGKRKALITSYHYGSNEWHKEEQWLMRASDYDKDEVRYFAMKDMSNVKELL